MKSLYKDTPQLIKEAAYVARLSDQPENWGQELTSELLKQCPYLSDYLVNVVLDSVDPNRGFAFGFADVSNNTERPQTEHSEMGIPHVRIPLVVKDKRVKPFNVFLNGDKTLPLTEERFRQELFNPLTFDISAMQPRDPSLVEAITPPVRSGIGMGGEYKLAAAKVCPKCGKNTSYESPGFCNNCRENVKQASIKLAFDHISPQQWKALFTNPKVQKMIQKNMGDAKHPDVQNEVYHLASKIYGYHPKTASILSVVAPTMRESDVERVVNKIAADPNIQVGLHRAGIVPLLVEVFDNTKRASPNDYLRTLAESVEPSTVTIQKFPDGRFLMKQANAGAFVPGPGADGQVMEGDEAADMMGADNAQAMQPGQTVTTTANPVSGEDEESAAEPITRFGEYRVTDTMGNQLLGWVFPSCLAWDGTFSESPMAVFSNGSAYAFQDSIVGEAVGIGPNLPAEEARGDGVFYTVDRKGAKCTAPVTVQSGLVGPDGEQKYVCSDAFGNQFKVSLNPGLAEPMALADSDYSLPASWKFMRLNNQTQLQFSNEGVQNMNEVKTASSRAELLYNGSYHLRGQCGLEKLASKYTTDLDSTSAEFMLGVLGLDGTSAKSKVAQARRNGLVKMAGLKTITTLGEIYQEKQKVASIKISNFRDLRKDLIKEAASLEEEGTVNNLLSLNFINPENIGAFINYIPDFEENAEHLAEMLLSSYVGEEVIDEGSIEKAMFGLEEVVVGLKAAAQQGGK